MLGRCWSHLQLFGLPFVVYFHVPYIVHMKELSKKYVSSDTSKRTNSHGALTTKNSLEQIGGKPDYNNERETKTTDAS